MSVEDLVQRVVWEKAFVDKGDALFQWKET